MSTQAERLAELKIQMAELQKDLFKWMPPEVRAAKNQQILKLKMKIEKLEAL